MPHSPRFLLARRSTCVLIFIALGFLVTHGSRAQDSQQQAPAKTESAPAKTTSPDSNSASNASEVTSRDTPATFKVRVNLVLVRAVVRDAHGNIVNGLKKEDFQISDDRKPQVISTFAVETPTSHLAPAPVSPAPGNVSEEAPSRTATIAALPQRFVALVFDDTNMIMQDTAVVRDAASRMFTALAPTDRVGIHTTSGQLVRDFTDDRESLKQSLLGIIPRPLSGSGFHDCPEVGFYQADLIENKHDPQALAVATEDAVQCAFNGDETMKAQASHLAEAAAMRSLSSGETQAEYVYRHLEEAVRRLSGMPGQRILVMVSPGFMVTKLMADSTDLIDRANRSNVVINTIDARGLYTPDLSGDIADPPRDSFRTAGFKSSYRIQMQTAQTDVLAQLADGTGGTFFHNRNDIDEGLRKAVAAPPLSYLLGFSPQNLKNDGRYHTLKKALTNKQKFNIQARHGYYAPRTLN